MQSTVPVFHGPVIATLGLKKDDPMNETIILRSATIQDADLLLEWRNDPETRKASHNTAKVQRDEHISWLSRTLNNPNRRLFVAEEDGVPVGTVRADLSEGVWELSWTVAPNARRRGVAKRMVALLAYQISDPIRAEVKAGNLASARIAEHAGMKFDREANGVLHYVRAALR
jgi:RimJ/RimL family protein N-acetyltransferase